jgi:hypothetical protein
VLYRPRRLVLSCRCTRGCHGSAWEFAARR